MKPFTEYLQSKKYAPTTISSYDIEAQRFIKWCKRNKQLPQMIDYKNCLTYIKYLQRKSNNKKTINQCLGVVKIYFNYLIDQAARNDNPIEDTTIKGEKKTIIHNLLDYEELEDLYYSFETGNYQEEYHKHTLKRAKTIIGLLVYQGVNTTNLDHLKTEHLQLVKGKIYIPSARRSNARTLELKPWQIIELMEYINQSRPAIQVKMNNYSDQLFPTNGMFSTILYPITNKLKAYNQKVQHLKQIRASVITHWLKQHDLRTVQYMAGHRYISSTERYLQDDLESLHDIVNNFHPIS